MILFGYECPACLDYHRQVEGTIDAEGQVSIRCRGCGEVETFRRREVPA